MKLYEVHMIHEMRSVIEVAANSAEEARKKAYVKSFNKDVGWEEDDTQYIGTYEHSDLSDEEAEDYG